MVALLSLEVKMLHREFARWALVREVNNLSLGLTLLQVAERADCDLSLWLIERALLRCAHRPPRRRGGWRVGH